LDKSKGKDFGIMDDVSTTQVFSWWWSKANCVGFEFSNSWRRCVHLCRLLRTKCSCEMFGFHMSFFLTFSVT